MTICRFWQQGNCRNGSSCRFEHPGAGGGGGGGGGRGQYQNQNRYGPLQSGGGGGGGRFASAGRPNQYQKPAAILPFGLDKGAIQTDLTTERPMWILSAYGPGKNAPAQLFGGPEREQSFEEMRLRHYIAADQGRPQEAILEARNLWAAVEQQIQNILRDLDGAVQYIIDAEKQHPNRFDELEEIYRHPTGLPTRPQISEPAFGQPTPGNVFGSQQPQSQQPPVNPFATKTAFGGPSALGQASQVGGQAPAFGQPASLGAQGASAFGQPSSFGSQPSAFGQPTSLGRAPNPFAPAQPPTESLAPTQPAFGPPPQPAALGQPALGKPNPSQNPFAPSGTSSQPVAPTAAPTVTPSTLAEPSIPYAPAPVPSMQMVKPQGDTRKGPGGRLNMWHGRPVEYVTPPSKPDDNSRHQPYPCYRRSDGVLEKIHFPDGRKMPQHDNTGIEGKPEEYTDEATEAYAYLNKHGDFKDGIMPEVPPKREWIDWDF